MVFHRCSGKVLSKNIFDDLHHCSSCCHQSDDSSTSKMSSDHSLDSTQRANILNECDNYDDEESIFLYYQASSTVLEHKINHPCPQIEENISGRSIDSVSILPSKRASSRVSKSTKKQYGTKNEENLSGQSIDSESKLSSTKASSTALKHKKRQSCTEIEENISGQSIDSVSNLPSKRASSRVLKSQIEQSYLQNDENKNVFKIQNSSDNFSNDREVSRKITRTQSKLKNKENPLRDFKLPKESPFESDNLDEENNLTHTKTRKICGIDYPKKETYLKNTFIKYQDMHLSLEKFMIQSKDFSESKKSKFTEFYNFCMDLKFDKNFSRGISLRPSHDVPKGYVPTEHQSYSNEFYFYVFENMSVRRAFELYIDFIFEVDTSALKLLFSMECCSKAICNTRCNEKWELLKKHTVKVFIIRPEHREEF